jgi:methylated-DNA-protein-cysteine methyltransferase-like protein
MQPSSSFNAQVYALVRCIPPGKVLSYGRVAEMLGVPHGAREVGWALSALKQARNEPPVPWHRVLNAQGRISIKGSPEAALEQRLRLEAEGVVFDEHDTLDMSRYQWNPSPPELTALLQRIRAETSGRD